MKNIKLFSPSGFLAMAMLATLVGCSPKADDEVSPDDASPATNAAAPALRETAESMKQDAAAVSSQAQSNANQAADQVQAAADQTSAQLQQATATATPEVQNLVQQARNYLNDKKYAEALGTVQRLTNLKLTPEQQKLVDDLRAQVQSAMAKAGASDAASKLGNALGLGK